MDFKGIYLLHKFSQEHFSDKIVLGIIGGINTSNNNSVENILIFCLLLL